MNSEMMCTWDMVFFVVDRTSCCKSAECFYCRKVQRDERGLARKQIRSLVEVHHREAAHAVAMPPAQCADAAQFLRREARYEPCGRLRFRWESGPCWFQP